jgi:hypothetical protein
VVCLKAGIMQEGSYNLNRFSITVKQHNAENGQNTTLAEKANLKDLLIVRVSQRGLLERSHTTDIKPREAIELQE